MPKGYIISRVDVKDPAAYAKYAEGSTKAIAAHGGKPLARGGRFRILFANAAGHRGCRGNAQPHGDRIEQRQ